LIDVKTNTKQKTTSNEELKAAIQIYNWLTEKKKEPLPQKLHVDKYKEMLV
jgi:hypothetical protein